MPYTAAIAPVATTVGGTAAAATGVGLPLAAGLAIRSIIKNSRRKRAEANAQVAAAGGNPNPAFPGRDQYGRAQVENPDNPGFDLAGWPMSYAERGPGSGPMTNPAGIAPTIGQIANTIPWGSVVNPPDTTGQLPPSASPSRLPPEPDVAAPVQPPATQSVISSILPTAISAGTSLLGGYLQSRAASRAANVQSDAALQAAQVNREAGREAIEFNREALAQQQRNIQPWIDTGTESLQTIGGMVKDPGYGFTREFKAPTAEEAMMDPGIQFQLQQGSKALEASLKAKGLSLSGKAVKEINQFAQGVAGQGYQNVYNRSAQDYERAYNVFSNERSARLNPLLSMAGLGQTSVGQLNAAVGSGADRAANITLGTAANVTDQQTQASNARASGYVGSANAYSGALSNIGNTIVDAVTLRDVLRRLPLS